MKCLYIILPCILFSHVYFYSRKGQKSLNELDCFDFFDPFDYFDYLNVPIHYFLFILLPLS